MVVDEIPEVVVGTLSLRHFVVWLRLDGVDYVVSVGSRNHGGRVLTNVRELERLLNEKHRNVVADDIPITFVCVEFYGKPSHISNGVCAASASLHGGEPKEDWCGTRSILQDFGSGDVLKTLEELEMPVSSGTTGVDDTFWDTLMVESVNLRMVSWWSGSLLASLPTRSRAIWSSNKAGPT